MKVSFKLNAEQLLVAKAIAAEVEKESEDLKKDPDFNPDKNQYWCGNLLGYQGHSFSFNSDQDLQLLDNGVVQYQGQRHPLIQDGGLDVLARIAGFTEKFPYRGHEVHLRKEWYERRNEAIKGLKVLNYETSDQDLSWWETADYKAERLVKKGEVTVEMLKPLVALAKNGSRLKGAEHVLLSVLDNIKPAQIGTPEYRQACAEGNQEWRLLAAKYQEAKAFWN